MNKEKTENQTKYGANFINNQSNKPTIKRPNSASVRYQNKTNNSKIKESSDEKNVKQINESNVYPKITNKDMNYLPDPYPNLSMFEQYYKDRLIEEKVLPEPNFDEEKESELDEKYKKFLKEQEAKMNIEERMEKDYEMMKKVKLKGKTPGLNEKGIILQKSNRNFIEENKMNLGENRKKIENKYSTPKENGFHKYFGKTPKYLISFKEEAELQKQIEKQRKLEAKNPKGTRQISEEERVMTLNKLIENKNEIQNLIEKLPISMGSKTSKVKQEELFRKMDELDNAINTFSRKKVFVKINE